MLPVAAVLPELLATLEAQPSAVLVAPPGAGKTTGVPPALLGSSWRGDGKVIVVEPRRLAARAAAARVAELLGEPLGRTVGYRVRNETRLSAATRIELVTSGVESLALLSPGVGSAPFVASSAIAGGLPI